MEQPCAAKQERLTPERVRELGIRLKAILELNGSPVGVRLLFDEQERPPASVYHENVFLSNRLPYESRDTDRLGGCGRATSHDVLAVHAHALSSIATMAHCATFRSLLLSCHSTE